MADAGAAGDRKLKVFISYSRAEQTFADEVGDGLEFEGSFNVTIDRSSIVEGEDWKARLGALIADADTIVFILSPASAKSDVCAWEVEEAARLSKRVIPVLAKPLEGVPAPPRLAALNYVRFDDRTYIAGLAALSRALKADLDWIREHTRLLARAMEWQAGGRSANRLLTGDDIANANAWAARRSKDAPEPTTLHLDFIKESEEAEVARSSVERQRLEREKSALRRGQRALAGAAGLFACIIIGAIGWYKQDFLKEQYYWRVVMRPSVLTANQEKDKAANPGSDFKECSNGCPTMIVVPAGKFQLGSLEDSIDENERPQHEVTIAKPFAVGRTDVTFDEWGGCVAAGACPKVSDDGWGRGDRPVIEVSWEEAKGYITWLKRMTGKDYRLLSEAEWEYSARAGNQGRWSFGDDEAQLGEYAWFIENSDHKTQPVAKKKPNAFGLYDMHGNVWQWVEDPYHKKYHGAPSDGSVWSQGGDVSNRVLRGGSWFNRPQNLRSTNRSGGTAENRELDLGFRVGRTLTP
jgi:formylglycine-generating enzyme required for sulfatase activity